VRAVMAVLKVIVGAMFAGFRRARASCWKPCASSAARGSASREPRARDCAPWNRAFWIVLSRTWSRWREVLAIAKPATVIAWHRRGFARFWRRSPGRWDARRSPTKSLRSLSGCRATTRSGVAANRERAGEAGSRRRQEHGRQVHAQARGAAAGPPSQNVGHVCSQPPRGYDRHRFLDGAYSDVRCLVRVLCSVARTPTGASVVPATPPASVAVLGTTNSGRSEIVPWKT